MTKQNFPWTVEIETQDDSEILITGELEWQTLSDFKVIALEHIKSHAEIDGFRKGQAPDEMVVAKVGEMAILGEAAGQAIQSIYPQIVAEHKLKVIGQPSISITKLAPDNPLGFSITTAVLPEIKLADYKAIAKTQNAERTEPAIDEEEFEETLNRIRSMNADHSEHEHKEGEECKYELPELTDKMVAKFGDYKSVDEFKEFMRAEMLKQKKEESLVSGREAMLKTIVEKSDFSVPGILVESELDKMFAQMKDDIERMGLKYDDYLKNSGKKESELREEWREEAHLRAQSELVLKEIARTEDLSADKERLDEQVAKIAEVHKDVPMENIRLYIEAGMINQAVLEFLDKQ